MWAGCWPALTGLAECLTRVICAHFEPQKGRPACSRCMGTRVECSRAVVAVSQEEVGLHSTSKCGSVFCSNSDLLEALLTTCRLFRNPILAGAGGGWRALHLCC